MSAKEFEKDDYVVHLDEVIGQGAQGTVFKCHFKDSMDLLVAKRVPDPDYMVMNEVNNLRLVCQESPYVLQYKHSFYDRDSIYIITEFCEKTLSQVMEGFGGKLPESVARLYFLELILGLQALHAKNIMHRDIKLDNLFIKGNTLKIGDLGFSKQSSYTNSVLGSPSNFAPEMLDLVKTAESSEVMEGKQAFVGHTFIEGSISYDKNIDVWASGVCLFQMVTGKHPFEVELSGKFEDDIQRLKELQKTKKDIFEGVKVALSESLKDLLRNMLKVERNERFSFSAVAKTRWFTDGLIEWDSELNASSAIERSLEDNYPASAIGFKGALASDREVNLASVEAFRKFRRFLEAADSEAKFCASEETIARMLLDMAVERAKTDLGGPDSQLLAPSARIFLFLKARSAALAQKKLEALEGSDPAAMGLSPETLETLRTSLCRREFEEQITSARSAASDRLEALQMEVKLLTGRLNVLKPEDLELFSRLSERAGLPESKFEAERRAFEAIAVPGVAERRLSQPLSALVKQLVTYMDVFDRRRSKGDLAQRLMSLKTFSPSEFSEYFSERSEGKDPMAQTSFKKCPREFLALIAAVAVGVAIKFLLK